jgi:polysaccharide deacetylase 2 family uncharacterized protein YibQ
MPGRRKIERPSRLSRPSRPRRFAVTWLMFLTWCATLLMGGGMGALSQGLYRTYRAESVGGRNDLAAVPYQPREQGQTKQEKMAAIVIDDLGLDLKMARKFWELKIPVTLAILPYQRHSRRVAREALRHGKEVILHLPLQPRDFPAVNPGTGALLLSMDREQIQAEVAQQLDALPGCVGVSNHMGSLFTEKEAPMRWVLSVVAERHLFFVDSLTTPNSLCRCVALDLGVPFAQRTHFLDVEKTEESIVRQLCCLLDKAVQEGGAIGIAHPSVETLAALPKVSAAFADKGVRLVPVSEMVASQPLFVVRDQGSGTRGQGKKAGH